MNYIKSSLINGKTKHQAAGVEYGSSLSAASSVEKLGRGPNIAIIRETAAAASKIISQRPIIKILILPPHFSEKEFSALHFVFLKIFPTIRIWKKLYFSAFSRHDATASHAAIIVQALVRQ